MAIKKEAVIETETGTDSKYWKIQSMDFLFLEVSLGLILYPGSYAYITDEQKASIPEYALSMVNLSEIEGTEYQAKIGSQGILGLG